MNLILLSAPCLSQESDTICFTTNEAKVIFKYANKGRWCDSLTYQYEREIEFYKDLVQTKDYQIELGGELVEKQASIINDLAADLANSDRKKRLREKLLIITGGLLAIETIYILSLL